MAEGINYEMKKKTSFTKDGKVLLWSHNPQTRTMETTIIRDMTKEEIKRTYRILKDFGKRVYLKESVLKSAGVYEDDEG